MKAAPVLAAVCLAAVADGFQQQHAGQIRRRTRASASARAMKPSSSIESDRRFDSASQPQNAYNLNDRAKITSLSVATLEGAESLPGDADQRSLLPQLGSVDIDAVTKVSSAALLITGNTVGSSMFVLPDAVGGVGMICGSAIFFGLYLYNLASGLLIADVAINLHENSDCEVPSSFKDFVDTAMKSEVAGTVMAGTSLLSNSLFLAFGTVHAGQLFASTFPGLGLPPGAFAGAFAAAIAMCASTQTNRGLESIANAAVLVLFSSFASLLVPSLASISDPMATWYAPGTNPDGLASAIAATVPLLLSSLTYQNIVPSITKLLDFDRTKSTIAVAVGSFLPMAMYVAWCFAVLGGGLDSLLGNDAGAAAFTAFSASALVGSCVAATMSLAEEYDSIISSATEDDGSCQLTDKFSLPAVALSMAPPVAVALACAEGGELTGALHFNGAFITPFLYGLLPILLIQSMEEKEAGDNNVAGLPSFSLPQVILGAGTIGAVGQELAQDLMRLMA
ncbi:hypothetical protein ACHAXT_006687 [Thalassiosira profunda]